jgi:gliding motility-associated-like protein
MHKRIQHIIVLLLLLSGSKQGIAQIAMPDTVCAGTTKTYKVNDATVPSTYTWRINGVLQSSTKNDITITWNTPGVFELTVQERSSNGCEGDIRSGTVYVNPLPVANAGPDAVYCFGTVIRLNGTGGTSYQWLPPTGLSATTIANPFVTMSAPGTHIYSLAVSSNGCKSVKSDSVAITILPPAKVFAGNDTSVVINRPLQLNAIDVNNVGFNSYVWSPPFALSNSAIQNPIATFTNITNGNGVTYTVTARTPNGCIARDDINIKAFLKAEVFVPNAFTPNNDRLNDLFYPTLVGMKELKYFSIFNRYGQLIFTTSKEGEGWDGMFNGQPQPQGAFVWMVEAIDFDGNVHRQRGNIYLIR